MAQEPSNPFSLSDTERAECRRIAQTESAPHAQRASALLLIDGGDTHREAGGKTGLSIGQVRYALNRFRRLGLALFPLPAVEEVEKEVKKKGKNKKEKALGKKTKKEKKGLKKKKKDKEQKNASGSQKKKGKKKKGKKKKK